MPNEVYTGTGWYWVEGMDVPVWIRGTAFTDFVEFIDCDKKPVWTRIGIGIKPIARIEKPEPRPTMDWSVLPAWAKWVAKDESGKWWWHCTKPSIHCNGWVCGNGGGIIPDYVPNWKGDWRNSLVEVPR